MVFLHSSRDKTFSGFIAENHNRFTGRYLQKAHEFIVVSSRNLQHLVKRLLLNNFIEIWYNNETLLFTSSLSIDKDVFFRGHRTIDFKQTCISNLIFVGLYKQKSLILKISILKNYPIILIHFSFIFSSEN